MEALIPLLIIVVLFFVMIVLPQRRQMSARRALIESVKVGDQIVTSGGIHGSVRTLDDTTMGVEVADGVVITLARQAVSARIDPSSSESPDAATAVEPADAEPEE